MEQAGDQKTAAAEGIHGFAGPARLTQRLHCPVSCQQRAGHPCRRFAKADHYRRQSAARMRLDCIQPEQHQCWRLLALVICLPWKYTYSGYQCRRKLWGMADYMGEWAQLLCNRRRKRHGYWIQGKRYHSRRAWR